MPHVDDTRGHRDEREDSTSRWVNDQNKRLRKTGKDDVFVDDDDEETDASDSSNDDAKDESEEPEKTVEEVISDGLKSVKQMEEKKKQFELVENKQKEDLEAVKKQEETMKALSKKKGGKNNTINNA